MNGMEFNGFPKPKEETQKPIRERVFFPHADAIVKAYEKNFGKEVDPSEIEALREIIASYLEQRVEKTYIHKSENMGASFAYSMTDTSELAKTLYSKFTKDKIPELKEDASGQAPKNEKEFMFVGGFINAKAGNEYASQEEVMHRMIEELPSALQAISEGKKPKQKQIYTLASPTNELGEISDKFMEGLKDSNASAQFGLLYAELVSSMLAEDAKEGKKTSVYFNGVSMGAGFAIETAKKLLAEGAVTQSHEEDKPFLQVQINIPPGQSNIPEKRKKWQIPLGFGVEVAHSMLTDPYMRTVMMNDAKFIGSKNDVLAEKGISINMSPEQAERKKKVISNVVQSLVSGVPVPDELKVTEVIGKSDPLMYSSEFRERVREQRGKFTERRETEGESLGENIVSNPNSPNRRTFGISTSHSIPFLRNSEFQRLQRAAKSLSSLKKE